jgi:membrane-associated HD superfamily phosphohydrolase
MVKPGFRFVPLLALALLPVLNLHAKELGDYQLGDKAEEDIVATSKLSFVDPEGTDTLRKQEALRVPIVIRYYTNAASDVEAQFHQAFTQTREDFLASLNKAFGHAKLSAEELSSFKFNSLAILFQKQNELFPLSTNRAALWAAGDDDQSYEASLVPLLRKAMSSPIRPEPVPEEFKLTGTVRLMPLGSPAEIVTAQEASQTTHNFARTNFPTVSQVRKDFQTIFPKEERDVAKYLASLLKPNCVVDESVTRQLRARRTEGMWSVCDYEPGQIVAHRGQVIDRKVKAAIDLLKEKAVVGQLQELQVKQQAAVGQLQQIVVTDREKDNEARERLRWFIAALAGAILVLALAVWQLARRRNAVALLPVPAGATVGELEWQQRALLAEQRSEKLQTAARAGLIAQMSQWLSGVLTQRLISQRRQLLDSQNNAATEMAELEARLERVQAPLQVRLAAYEHRIAELEKDLAARGEENRELLKAKIEMMRKQLETERERNKNRLEFN